MNGFYDKYALTIKIMPREERGGEYLNFEDPSGFQTELKLKREFCISI